MTPDEFNFGDYTYNPDLALVSPYSSDATATVDAANAAAGMFGSIMSFYAIFMFICFLYFAAEYVLRGLAVYKVAQNRKMDRPWLAWIPFARTWLFGSISDDIRARKGTKKTSHSKLLLTFSIIMNALPILSIISFIVMLAGLAGTASTGGDFAGAIVGGGIVFCVLILCCLVASVLYKVFFFICHYDVYKDYASSQSTLFTIITVLADVMFSMPVVGSIFLLALSNNKSDTLDGELTVEEKEVLVIED